jgi:hypothetical protein
MRTKTRFNVLQSAVAMLTSACLLGLATPAQSAGPNAGQGWWPWTKAHGHTEAAETPGDWPLWFKPALNTPRVANQVGDKSQIKNADTLAAKATVNPRQVEFSTLFAELDDAMRVVRRAAALERMIGFDHSGQSAPSSDVAALVNHNQVKSEPGKSL